MDSGGISVKIGKGIGMSVFSEKQTIQEELETCLEKFLDILAEVEKTGDISIPFPMRSSETPSQPLPCPEGLAGAGFAITFPFRQAVGLFIIAHREDLLPDWYRHPGIAGKSRLFLLGTHLAQFFSHDWEEKNRSFFDSSDYFAGAVEALEGIFPKITFSAESSLHSFQIRRWDGQSTNAWLIGPVSSVEMELPPASITQLAIHHTNLLKPVRPLEGTETSLFYAPFSEELEEILSEPATEEVIEEKETPLPEKNDLLEVLPSQEELETLRQELEEELGKLTSFSPSQQFRNFPALRHQRRREQILIRIQYAHPAHTQAWRKQVENAWKTLKKRFSQSLSTRETQEKVEETVLQEKALPVEMLLTETASGGMLPETGDWEYCTQDYPPQAATVALASPPEKMPDIPHRPALPRPRIGEEKVLGIPVTFSVVVARQKIPLQTFLQLRPGDILNFQQKMETPMEIFVEQQKRGLGIPIEYEGRVGIQILEEGK